MSIFSYRMKVERKHDGKALAYTTVKARSLSDAREILFHRFHVPPSKREAEDCPIAILVKRGGEYRTR
jgi:hypothetical protein